MNGFMGRQTCPSLLLAQELLDRAIASSTACSGLMPSVDDAVGGLRPDVVPIDVVVPPVAGDGAVRLPVGAWLASGTA